ncbi:MAG TPA: ferrochelatase [Geminicoccaceae bacterium]|nr:ferrochelatase [Geminicoccaceae bacterium]
MTRTAIVLFNLGGPDRLESVKPFLFNLFYDPAITEMAAPFRWLFAKLITARREKAVQANYALMGGRTPLLEETEAQMRALEKALAERGPEVGEVRCFMAMRYWHPLSEAAVAAVADWRPDRILLLPLYPQYSAATTGSSLAAWHDAARAAGLDIPTRAVCCYPLEPGFVRAHAALIREAWPQAAAAGRPRLLFSAHGLPEAFIRKGDPYQWQIEQTCAAVAEALDITDLDWRICYQSRVGPQTWIGPFTDQEVERAGADRVPLVVCPIAFVSEHIETLVEMDDEYAALAARSGVPTYVRVPTLSARPGFVEALAALACRHLAAPATEAASPCGADLGRLCPARFQRCPCRRDAAARAAA